MATGKVDVIDEADEIDVPRRAGRGAGLRERAVRGDEVDVIDEIDVPRRAGRGTGLRSGLGIFCQGIAKLRPGTSMTSMASVTSPAQTGSKYVSGSAGSYHSLIQNCV